MQSNDFDELDWKDPDAGKDPSAAPAAGKSTSQSNGGVANDDEAIADAIIDMLQGSDDDTPPVQKPKVTSKIEPRSVVAPYNSAKVQHGTRQRTDDFFALLPDEIITIEIMIRNMSIEEIENFGMTCKTNKRLADKVLHDWLNIPNLKSELRTFIDLWTYPKEEPDTDNPLGPNPPIVHPKLKGVSDETFEGCKQIQTVLENHIEKLSKFTTSKAVTRTLRAQDLMYISARGNATFGHLNKHLADPIGGDWSSNPLEWDWDANPVEWFNLNVLRQLHEVVEDPRSYLIPESVLPAGFNITKFIGQKPESKNSFLDMWRRYVMGAYTMQACPDYTRFGLKENILAFSSGEPIDDCELFNNAVTTFMRTTELCYGITPVADEASFSVKNFRISQPHLQVQPCLEIKIFSTCIRHIPGQKPERQRTTLTIQRRTLINSTPPDRRYTYYFGIQYTGHVQDIQSMQANIDFPHPIPLHGPPLPIDDQGAIVGHTIFAIVWQSDDNLFASDFKRPHAPIVVPDPDPKASWYTMSTRLDRSDNSDFAWFSARRELANALAEVEHQIRAQYQTLEAYNANKLTGPYNAKFGTKLQYEGTMEDRNNLRRKANSLYQASGIIVITGCLGTSNKIDQDGKIVSGGRRNDHVWRASSSAV